MKGGNIRLIFRQSSSDFIQSISNMAFTVYLFFFTSSSDLGSEISYNGVFIKKQFLLAF